MEGLLKHGVSVEAKDAKGYTPIMIACYNNQIEAVRFLLDNGADINGADFGGNTALMGVCFKGYADIAQLLIYSGANLNQMHGNGGTALMFAAMFGRNDMLKQLLDAGADKPLPMRAERRFTISPLSKATKVRCQRKYHAALYARQVLWNLIVTCKVLGYRLVFWYSLVSVI
ncbi:MULTISPECIES: ankyrin repeat domain-containing protein [unclassified Mucilaginibacter]|uniref:ankyrin repeat domain-containing protein n=1 Tax=unclassified Mucilaginibacter TaxID=2617802 RepID=UPI002AC97BD3|nr:MULTISPECIES: ankyrin repeat domain-containing protein [unclassified Mucilaginibacter]MEB0248877.1 ankyrin repeat domain-containing protein [Mucilaginibacter sp. 5B2]MEB0263229.1 ankyrin repeat domain-containing protein [Mucilaginibacter sp. 10I4]MEB0280324.1 ankyrin repeat domain-containing protein [Mucilaginibacter sp. 10B2]MEB0300269.1 ankyrin repeat domain-containing protein [Mucilaginibacter sp. 5C4]WPX25716.1 ankyrin repeat domain-containing protein [Mucilaginibacter sp. 5C4]